MKCSRCGSKAVRDVQGYICLFCGDLLSESDLEQVTANRDHAEKYAGDTRKFRGGFGAGSGPSQGEMGIIPGLGKWSAYAPEVYNIDITTPKPGGITGLGRWDVLTGTDRGDGPRDD